MTKPPLPEQLSLLFPPGRKRPIRPRARRTDPETSHQAAADATSRAGAQRATIMGLYRELGPLTNDAIDERMGWRAGTASRRVAELVEAGLVTRLTEKRLTRTGSLAFLHTTATP